MKLLGIDENETYNEIAKYLYEKLDMPFQKRSHQIIAEAVRFANMNHYNPTPRTVSQQYYHELFLIQAEYYILRKLAGLNFVKRKRIEDEGWEIEKELKHEFEMYNIRNHIRK